MALTSADLDALVASWRIGALTVEEGGRRVTYRSRADMERQIATIAAALNITNPLAALDSAQSRVTFASFSKG